MNRVQFDAIAFAGGGNRCYWQGGFWETFTARHPQTPRFVVGVSAGAYQAAIALAGIGHRARRIVFEACATNTRTFDWSLLKQGKTPFLVAGMYRDLLEQLFGPAELEALRRAPPLLVQLAHGTLAPPGLVALPAIGLYQLEKALTGAKHSSAGRYLGLTPDWASTHDMRQPGELVDALMATAAVPPFMPVGRVAGRAALDGGLVDNPPTLKLEEAEGAGGRTLLIATRPGAPYETVGARTVVRPSEVLGLSRFSVTDAAGLRAAYELGKRDGEVFARRLLNDAP
jgi:predicted acylesterase/phospholipase RssA